MSTYSNFITDRVGGKKVTTQFKVKVPSTVNYRVSKNISRKRKNFTEADICNALALKLRNGNSKPQII